MGPDATPRTQHLIEDHDLQWREHHFEPDPKPSVEDFVRTRAEIAEREVDTLCDDLRHVLFEMRLDIAQGHIFKISTDKAESLLAEIKSLLERRWNDEKIIEFIEQNDL